MPVKSTCLWCGQETIQPDPPPKSKEENIQFRKDWDARFEAGQNE